MSLTLNQIKAPLGSRKRKKIRGHGRATGHGKTSGRGQKGQTSRAGRDMLYTLEGGQMPFIRRLPKVGFRSKRPILNQVVNVHSLNRFEKGTIVTAELLKIKGLISSLNKPFKILGDGEIKKALTLQVESISQSAREKILKAGGKIESPADKK